MLQGGDDRQAHLLAADVSGRRFAEFRFGGPDAEQIIPKLEGDAQRTTKCRKLRDLVGVRGGEPRAHLGGALHQSSRFAANHRQIEFHADLALAFKAHVEMLAFAERQAGAVKEAGQRQDGLGINAGASQFQKSQASDTEEAVAGIDCLGLAPQLPERRAMMTERVAIFDVVVDEREIMDQLNGSGCWKDLFELIGDVPGRCSGWLAWQAGPVGEEQQRGA